MSDTTEAPEAPKTATIRLVTNHAFGYKGRMFEKLDDQSRPRDYPDIDEGLAVELCDQPKSRFRRVDENGDVIPNQDDLDAEAAAEQDRADRTIRPAGARNVVQVNHDTGKAEPKAEAKAADSKAPTEKKAGKITIKPSKKLAEDAAADAPAEGGEGEGGEGTDGAVEA